MSEEKRKQSPRVRLIREAATLQIKLMVDGIRDAILIPVSLVAALVGFLRGGDEPDLEFKRVLKLGRRTERWINLFGQHDVPEKEPTTGSIDQILEQAEAAVIEQYKKGRPPMEPDSSEKEETDEKP
jgi:hypothetical protein